MERKYLKDLVNWMNDEDKKPLLVTGARQVGKTYLIKDIFAEMYYKDKYLRIDCSDDEEFVNYVYKNNNVNYSAIKLPSIDYMMVFTITPQGRSRLISPKVRFLQI